MTSIQGLKRGSGIILICSGLCRGGIRVVNILWPGAIQRLDMSSWFRDITLGRRVQVDETLIGWQQSFWRVSDLARVRHKKKPKGLRICGYSLWAEGATQPPDFAVITRGPLLHVFYPRDIPANQTNPDLRSKIICEMIQASATFLIPAMIEIPEKRVPSYHSCSFLQQFYHFITVNLISIFIFTIWKFSILSFSFNFNNIMVSLKLGVSFKVLIYFVENILF